MRRYNPHLQPWTAPGEPDMVEMPQGRYVLYADAESEARAAVAAERSRVIDEVLVYLDTKYAYVKRFYDVYTAQHIKEAISAIAAMKGGE